MPAPRRAEYDSDEFRDMWFSDATLEDMAAKYGVTAPAIWLAGTRRFPMRFELRANDTRNLAGRD